MSVILATSCDDKAPHPRAVRDCVRRADSAVISPTLVPLSGAIDASSWDMSQRTVPVHTVLGAHRVHITLSVGDLATLYKVQVPVRQQDQTRVNIRQEDKTRVNIRQEDKTRVNIRQEDKTRVHIRQEDKTRVHIRQEDKTRVHIRQEDKTRVSIRQEDKTRVNIRQEDKTRVNIRQEDKTRVNLSVRPATGAMGQFKKSDEAPIQVSYEVESVAGQTPVPPSDPPGDPMPRVQETDVRDDRAMQQVLQSIRQVAERRQEVMMVLSQLQFRKYLDNKLDPITAAAARLLPRPATLGIRDGDLDILLVSRQYGLVVGEVKSVGHKPKYTTDQAIVKTVQKAVKQLKKADVTLRQLVSDLAPVNVTRILMLPNITSQRLMTALSTDSQTEQRAQRLEAERIIAERGTSVNVWEQQIPLPLWPAVFVPTVVISGHDLQYRDTIILCLVPRDDMPVVSRLRARGVPVQVVTSDDDEAAIRNVALSTGNQVTVTDWRVVSGLERRVVVAMGNECWDQKKLVVATPY
nr:hypothetical protein BaRGS_016903 [Batillaria attramentaria]